MFHGIVKGTSSSGGSNGKQQVTIREFVFEHMPGQQQQEAPRKKKKKGGKASLPPIESHCTDMIAPPRAPIGDLIAQSKMLTPMPSNKVIQLSPSLLGSDWVIMVRGQAETYGYVRALLSVFYSFYRERSQAIQIRYTALSRKPERPKVRFQHLETSTYHAICYPVNRMIKRIGRISLRTVNSPPYIISMFYGPWHALYDSRHLQNPLQSLSSEHATALIDQFFNVHPYSILFNKTHLMRDYWNDSASPFLLAVIYGTTQYYSHLQQGIPLVFWENSDHDNHNPFLLYAHRLLDTIRVGSSTVSDYQGIAVLALFEAMFGRPSVGMSLIATSYGVAAALGFWDGRYKPKDAIEEELVGLAFWAIYRSTTYGNIEVGCSVVDPLVQHPMFALPPCNMSESLSAQHDLQNNNTSLDSPQSWLIETFYASAVICHFTGMIHSCLPRPLYNIFGRRAAGYDNAFQFLALVRKIEHVELRIHVLLDEYYFFIQQNRDRWTPLQQYLIETSYRLYRVHFWFLKPMVTSGAWTQEELDPPKGITADMDWLDPTDPDIATRLDRALPVLLDMTKDLELLCAHANNFTHLPWDMILPTFETAATLLMAIAKMDPANQSARHALHGLWNVTNRDDISHAAIHDLRRRIYALLKDVPTPPTAAPPADVPLTLFHPVDPQTSQPQVHLHPSHAPQPSQYHQTHAQQPPSNMAHGHWTAFDSRPSSSSSSATMQPLFPLDDDNDAENKPVILHPPNMLMPLSADTSPNSTSPSSTMSSTIAANDSLSTIVYQEDPLLLFDLNLNALA
ncbi:hypothetical protein BC940DRAFT_315828 [Gongronella butleri]|nr:hypothetical protein BC940DRAFT_315828 [Gongronella butleri]